LNVSAQKYRKIQGGLLIFYIYFDPFYFTGVEPEEEYLLYPVVSLSQ
jgi:hypothetical protein